MAGDDFLSRWSRRKREVAQDAARTPQAEPGPHAIPGPGADAAADLGERMPADADVEEMIARLPSLDTLTAETDLTQFLRAGVPQVLRNAAMRRMWSLDPAIRDYLGEAREYAFDWHIPGAVPGTGPMLPTDDIAGMVRDIFAGTKVEPATIEAAGEPTTEAGSAPARVPEPSTGETAAPEAPSPPAAPHPVRVAALPEPPEDTAPSRADRPDILEKPRAEGPVAGRLRRHGGAAPI